MTIVWYCRESPDILPVISPVSLPTPRARAQATPSPSGLCVSILLGEAGVTIFFTCAVKTIKTDIITLPVLLLSSYLLLVHYENGTLGKFGRLGKYKSQDVCSGQNKLFCVNKYRVFQKSLPIVKLNRCNIEIMTSHIIIW